MTTKHLTRTAVNDKHRSSDIETKSECNTPVVSCGKKLYVVAVSTAVKTLSRATGFVDSKMA